MESEEQITGYAVKKKFNSPVSPTIFYGEICATREEAIAERKRVCMEQANGDEELGERWAKERYHITEVTPTSSYRRINGPIDVYKLSDAPYEVPTTPQVIVVESR